MNTTQRLMLFKTAKQVMEGVSQMSWFRKGSAEEDKVVAESAEVLLEGLSDADFVNAVKGDTGENLRDQTSVEQAQDWDKEAKLRRWGFGRN